MRIFRNSNVPEWENLSIRRYLPTDFSTAVNFTMNQASFWNHEPLLLCAYLTCLPYLVNNILYSDPLTVHSWQRNTLCSPSYGWISGMSNLRSILMLKRSHWSKLRLLFVVSWFIYKGFISCDRLCGLVVRVHGYRSGGPGPIPGTTRKKNNGSRTGSSQPREYNWGATW
jgi:hypothetical protein